MRKKIVGLFVCMLLFMLVIPVENSSGNSDVEINLFAGTKQRNIGTGIGFEIFNNGDEPVTINLICKMDYYQNSESISLNITVNPNDHELGNFGVLGGIKRISASAQVDDYIVIREGFSICQLVIFKK